MLKGKPEYRELVNATVIHTVDYDYIQKVYELVNIEREKAGVPPLALDATLCESANQRGAEISLYYSHIRASGDSFATALPGARNMAENIAAGHSSVNMVMGLV